MALPSSGEISVRDIAIETGTSLGELNFKGLATGAYFTTNTASSSYPDSAPPYALDEFYSYDHSASAGWSLTNSIQCDGVNDWMRQTGSGYGNICELFNSGGTLAVAFKCTGNTSGNNQYLAQGAWGGGQNWLYQARNFSGSYFQLRFRHDFSGSNYISEPHASSGQRSLEIDTWYFTCITYDNSSTSNNMTWYYGKYSGTSLTTITSPVEIQSPSGNKATNVAQYPALSGGKGVVGKAWYGHITLVGAWTDILTSGEVTTLFNGGAPYQLSLHTDRLLFFHDMASVSGTTLTPEYGGSAHTITLTNGASQTTTIPNGGAS